MIVYRFVLICVEEDRDVAEVRRGEANIFYPELAKKIMAHARLYDKIVFNKQNNKPHYLSSTLSRR